ncbi:hypothetical protein [Flavobacterium kingsejongi]|uniref:Uncharacterized protein n=1 Tax=Flavobacterium kingsejongi TaxID=1678728 RepID=A0A2S1LQR1_9FLAO|nr:hypothetical protein [Flavobacterium kingsejongi]AWG26002.1 hypothetical protein FK004_12600 [Flavobacterium kingsejongi]
MNLDNTKKALNDFCKYVIQQSRTNLTKEKKTASGELYNSLGFDFNVSNNSFQLAFLMAPHGKFQDQGVSGTKKRFDTPYSYKDKMPPPSAFNQWVVRRNIAPRNEKGQFTSRKSLQFAIAKSIYENGIKPTKFFTTPFERAYQKLPDEIIEGFGLDFDNLLKYSLK